MAEIHHIGTPPIPVQITRNKRARRITLRVSNVDGAVKLTVPARTAVAEALDFARIKEDWVRKHLSNRPEATELQFGAKILFRGVLHKLHQGQGRGVQIDGQTLLIGGKEELLAAKLRGFLKEQARAALTHSSEQYGALVGRKIGKITLRDTTSRWGSCTSEGNLMYSWRLIMAPPGVLNYVAAHEVCHLLEMNHSAAYWAHVARICPNYQTQRAWLRKNGAQLHAVRL